MTIHITDRPVAQGDILIIPVSYLPTGLKPAQAADGYYVVGHSETGHHHVIERTRAEVYEAADDAFCAWIKTLGDGANVIHQRPFDTHETVAMEPNRMYKIRRQREYVPQGFRRAQD